MNTRANRIFLSSLMLILPAVFIALPARAALQIDITKSSDSAIPVAIAPFGAADQSTLPLNVAQVASDDLASTGLFKMFDQNNMVAEPSRPQDVNYANWQSASVDNLVVGSVASAADGKYRINFNLLDVPQKHSVASFQITAGPSALRSAAHTVANLIYQRFTGKKGYFLSRIAYITVTNDNGGRRFRLIVSDYDGNDPHSVYSSRDPIMSPAWSPDGRKLAYVAFDIRRGRSSLRVQDLASGKVREISSRPGINGAPAWSPDGSKLALTLSYQGSPDIYVYDLNTDQLTQLTHNSAIDTEPSWSANGRYIAFTSDRGGPAQIYRMTSQGGTGPAADLRRPEQSEPGVFARRLEACHGSTEPERLSYCGHGPADPII